MLFVEKAKVEPSFFNEASLLRINNPRQISPFLLNLNLNPLYSTLGGSTTRAEPFMKNPIRDDLRLNPLYK